MNNTHSPIVVQHSLLFRYLAYIAGLPLLYAAIAFNTVTRRQRRPRTRALITWRREILLVRNVADHNRWTLPGGGAKPNETYLESIAREIHEELTIRQSVEKLRFIKRYSKVEVGEPYDKICYSLDLSKSSLTTIKLSSEILEARWFSVQRLPDRLSPVVKLVLRDYPL